MQSYCDNYVTIKSRGLTEPTYTLTYHKFAVKIGGYEKKTGFEKEYNTEEKQLHWKEQLRRMEEERKRQEALKRDEELSRKDFNNENLSDDSSASPTEDEIMNMRFHSSIIRSRSNIAQYVANNSWDYFVTLTISPEKWGLKMDLNSLTDVKRKVLKFFQNYAYRRGEEFKYLLVPEFHKSGQVHFHGFMKGINENDLFINENGYLDFQPYRDKFGFCTMSKIADQNRAASYVTKYIQKDMFLGQKLVPNTHLYFASKGLKKDRLIFKGSASVSVDDFFEAGYTCFEFPFCFKVVSDCEDDFLSVVNGFPKYVSNINVPFTSESGRLERYIDKLKYERNDSVYNDSISRLENKGKINFSRAVDLWRDDTVLTDEPIKPKYTTPEMYKEKGKILFLNKWGDNHEA
jgi:hypothetical protein